MSELNRKALLPAGLRDVLPPEAETEAAIINRLVDLFGSHGYDRVDPPLVEFEDGLLFGPGASMADETFRLMDPVSQRMMGVRADITPQIARIAGTRLLNVPRPLRLSYAGDVLRVAGTQLRPDRQMKQIGAELIGSGAARADTEIILLAIEALTDIGIKRLSVDLTLPMLVPLVCDALGFEPARQTHLIAALNHRDGALVTEIEAGDTSVFSELLAASGSIDTAMPRLAALDLPAAAAAERTSLEAIVALLKAEIPTLSLTVDPVENRGFEYHSGVSFTIFAPGERSELGSGGRYVSLTEGAGNDDENDDVGDVGEPATGMTLYLESILRVLPVPSAVRRVFLPAGISTADARALRDEGWRTVAALAGTDTPDASESAMRSEAARLGCGYIYENGSVIALANGTEES